MKFTPRLFFAFLLALFVSACVTGHKKSDNTLSEVEEEVPLLGFHPGKYVADTIKVRSGDTFGVLLSRLGMSNQEAYRLTQLCATVFDVRKLRAGNELITFRDTTDTVSPLKYIVYAQDKVRSTVFQCADSLAVWNVSKPVTKQRKITDVTISSSLWNDMIASGASPELIMNLDDIYQWSVNFFTLQPGDRFRMIYTQTLCESEVVSIDTLHFSLFTGADTKQVAAMRFSTSEGGNTYWDKGGASLKRTFLKAPLKYNRVSSKFSYARKHPVTGVVKAHTAVDYAAPTGTPIQAIGNGTITKCGWDGTGGGNRIHIKHMRGYESSYMHLSSFAPGIKVGTRVSQGQVIGYVGATGTATGPHLDFRIWENGRPIDPLKLDSPASEPLNKKYLEQFNAQYDKYIAELDAN